MCKRKKERKNEQQQQKTTRKKKLIDFSSLHLPFQLFSYLLLHPFLVCLASWASPVCVWVCVFVSELCVSFSLLSFSAMLSNQSLILLECRCSARARKSYPTERFDKVAEKQDNTYNSQPHLYSITYIYIQLFYHNACDIILMSDEETKGDGKREKRKRKSIKSAKVLIFRDKNEWIYIYWVLLEASHSRIFCSSCSVSHQANGTKVKFVYRDMICTVWRPTNFARCHVALFFSFNKTIENV